MSKQAPIKNAAMAVVDHMNEPVEARDFTISINTILAMGGMTSGFILADIFSWFGI